MYKIIFMTLLTMVSCNAIAEWVELDRSEIQTSYANPSTIDISGSKIKLWLLSNYKTPHKYDGKSFFSIQSQNEYDCNEAQFRMLEYSLLSGKMGAGEVIQHNTNVNKWQQISKGSVDEIFWNAACNPAAGLVKVGDSETMFVYANPFSIRKNNNKVKMWELFDLKSAKEGDGGQKYLSVMHQAEYDCKENRYRTLTVSYHSENKAKGTLIFTDTHTQKWDSIVKESADEVFWKIACNNPK